MAKRHRFGTFEGVFTPTILTILGVILYLRLGWVVGNAGFGGALLIILLAKIVTVTTGLSIASMASNIKIGDGGSYAIISRSLGLEIGSAVGLPLYLSQALGAAMYIVGFSEGWTALFPHHNPLIVSSSVLVLLLTISMVSAHFALRAQYIIMFLIGFSLVSFFMGNGQTPDQILIWGNFESAPFWAVFAIFFPAVTGIEAGAAMSGELADPKTSLRRGILYSIVISFIVYVAVAFWLDRSVPSELLRSNYKIMLDISRWRSVLLAAILGATLSSALGALVGGPRTLLALGKNKVIPLGRFFAKRGKNGEPQVAILFTGLIVEAALLLGDLNTIAPLLTMFFLITYGTINLVVLIEKGTGIVSFRPTFNVPLLVPLIGTLWCSIAMFLINPIFAASAIFIILIVYSIQVRMNHRAPWGDVRQGLFTAIAEWAVRISAKMPASSKSWKPNLLVPIENPRYWRRRLRLVRDIIYPKGSVRLVTVKVGKSGVRQSLVNLVDSYMDSISHPELEPKSEKEEILSGQLNDLALNLKKEKILVTSTVLEADNFLEGISIATQALRSTVLPPNVLFLSMGDEAYKDDRLAALMAIGQREKMGILLVKPHPGKRFGDKKKIYLWLGSKTPNMNLSILTALQIERNWNGYLNLIQVVENEEKIYRAEKRLKVISDRARLPLDAENHVLVGEFLKELSFGQNADVNIFGVPESFNIKLMRKVAADLDTACIFVRAGGGENVMI
ncbi:MAG: amino acid permease [Candidatus Neomarinimicrobiota bacterium]